MNFRDLNYFVALAKLKNYTAAAQQFHVSQPTITYAIKRLEKELQVSLLQRDQSHRQIELTLAGQQFFQHAKLILHELTIAKQELASTKQAKIRFGLPPIIGTYYFPHLASYLAQHNLIQHLNTTEAGSAALLDQLKAGKLDMALLGSIQPLTDQVVQAQVLTNWPFKLIVSPQHPLAKQTQVSFKQLATEKFITLQEGFVHPLALQQLAKPAGFKPEIIYTTPDINLLKNMVAQNIGIGFLTSLALTQTDTIVPLKLSDNRQPQFLISFAYRQNQTQSPLKKQLFAQLRKGFTTMEV